MKLLMLLTVAAIAVGGVTRAGAQPSSAPHVDPKAPCFRWPAVDMDEDGVFDRVDHCVSTPKGCIVDAFGCETDADRDGVCDGLDRCPDTPRGTRVDTFGCPGAVKVEAEPPPVSAPPPAPPPPPAPRSAAETQLVETGRIRLENLYFETSSARLLPESEAALREAGEALEKFAYLKIEVQGHTDTRGAARFNLRLSQSRAEAVRAFLLEHFQLRRENLAARGYGEKRPETRERNDEELLRNRRVVLKVLNPEELPGKVKLER